MNNVDKRMLEAVADLHEIPQGAFSLRKNGESAERRSSANIIIEPKKINQVLIS